MEERVQQIYIGEAGGTAWKGSKTYKIAIPNKWVNELNITPEDRTVKLTFTDDKKIIIERVKPEIDNPKPVCSKTSSSKSVDGKRPRKQRSNKQDVGVGDNGLSLFDDL